MGKAVGSVRAYSNYAWFGHRENYMYRQNEDYDDKKLVRGEKLEILFHKINAVSSNPWTKVVKHTFYTLKDTFLW